MSDNHSPYRGRTRRQPRLNPWRELLEWVVSIVVAVSAALVFHTYVAQLVRIDGDSMEPTLHNNEMVVMTKFSYRSSTPQRGDIVVTHYPIDQEYYVKRVIGLPGEVVQVKDGVLTIDGQTLTEPYIMETMGNDFGPYAVEAGHVLVMGDNRNISLDSRSKIIGTLAIDEIMGKVQAVLWPPGDISGIGAYAGTLGPSADG